MAAISGAADITVATRLWV